MTTLDERPADTAPTPACRLLRELLVQALPGCRPETIERLIHTVRAQSVKPGEKIYRQGAPVNGSGSSGSRPISDS
jgi:hypothetical protein